MATPVLVDSDTGSTTTTTLTATVDISGSNRLGIVLVGILNDNQNENVVSVTFGSDSCDKLGHIENADDSRVEIWYYKNPTVNTGVTVTVTFAYAPLKGAGAWIGIFTGVDQSSTFGTYASGIEDGVDPHNYTVTAVTGDYLLANICSEYGVAVTITSGNQATELWTYELGSTHMSWARYTSTAGNFEFSFDCGTGTHTAYDGVAIKGTGVSYKLEGITYDKDGDVLVSVDCYLYKDNQDNTVTFKDHVVSDGATGAYSFTGIADNDAQYIVVFIKDDSPHVFDVTDHVLQPVVE